MASRQKSRPPGHRTRSVCNQSSRNGSRIVAIAVHTTESADVKGWDDLNGITSWFDTPRSQASAHVGIDGEGHSIRWVTDARKAWTILSLNPVTLNIEFVGRAAQPGRAFEEAQWREGARWAAYWCLRYNIPAQRGNVKARYGQAMVTRKGIIRHSDLTAAGVGEHTDPGRHFPMAKFLKAAQWYRKHGWYA